MSCRMKLLFDENLSPKLVWLRISNCTRQQIIPLITTHAKDIEALSADPFESVLALS